MSPALPSRPLAALLMLLAGLLSGPAGARAEEKVKVTVVAILATGRNQTVDPKLKCVADEVQKLDPKLTGFSLAKNTSKSLPVGTAADFPLVDKQKASVTVQHGPDKDNRVGLVVKPPGLGEIAYTTCCGKYFPIVTRYQTKDKDRLIIAIMVKPCSK